MTSLSRRKRPITAPNTSRATARNLVAAIAAGLAVVSGTIPTARADDAGPMRWAMQKNSTPDSSASGSATLNAAAFGRRSADGNNPSSGGVPPIQKGNAPAANSNLKWRAKNAPPAKVENDVQQARYLEPSVTGPVLQMSETQDNESAPSHRLEAVSPNAIALEPVKADTTSTSGTAKSIAVREPTPARREPLYSVMKASPELEPSLRVGRGTGVTTVSAEVEQTASANPRVARSVRVQTGNDDNATAPNPLSPPSLFGNDPPAAAPMPTKPLEPAAEARNNSSERCPPGKPCVESFADCAALAKSLKTNPISNIKLDISVKGVQGEDYPCTCPLEASLFSPRNWCETTYTWKASGVCYKPLYFEEAELERYGHNHGHCLQPLVSGLYFAGSVVLLPYKMGLETPCECVYPLGYYRPGNCAPRMCPAVPLSARAGLLEAGAVTGAVFIVP